MLELETEISGEEKLLAETETEFHAVDADFRRAQNALSGYAAAHHSRLVITGAGLAITNLTLEEHERLGELEKKMRTLQRKRTELLGRRAELRRNLGIDR